jgi:hypothetical protein
MGVADTTEAPAALLCIQRSIVGPVQFEGTVGRIEITDSIVGLPPTDEANAPVAIGGGTDVDGGTLPAPLAVLQGTTVFGRTVVHALDLASNCIFWNTVTVEARQVGCVRFSYVPVGSSVPRRYRCIPDVEGLSDAEAEVVLRDVKPVLVSDDLSAAGYARLARECPLVVREGADDESEMGAWHFRMEPQREANLVASLGEYLRFGLDAGLFFEDESTTGTRQPPAWQPVFRSLT